jgi:hypothetical protein
MIIPFWPMKFFMKHKQSNGGLIALKLDIEKAFDFMVWDFILKILRLLVFLTLFGLNGSYRV